ncbi:MarR family winged helix-turn-helix transcriptional regulator [Mycoplana rhizolycopersici]|jgi:MarR family transcriptional regulator for hemolysin|uniref:MarR family transcriptional regulator n=1 Tax=Mycoplana rhizolycopersici TaxID=2746702 RepID=A0ABX2Q9C5_9HYPH|nr:MarR family transcriptional regulator [Rhizobium rhizolycopersici]NVP54327.1 MarR family transcriptional regulator [Rhizobium rhizolycopersici]
MSTANPNDVILEELSRAGRKMRALFDARVKERGLTLSRARTLLILSKRQGLTQRELAEELDIETPTLVRLLDGMEKQAFIERRNVDGDRRAKQIVMTAGGEIVALEIQELAHELRRDLLKGVSDEDMATTLRVLRNISACASTSCRESV